MMAQPHYETSFPCEPTQARKARKAVAAFAQTWLKGNDSTDFETAVGEAFANAIEHGGCSVLTVHCWYDRNRLITDIQQNGSGFEAAHIPAPAQGSLRGYGLFIMRSVMDRVEFLENGTCVRLVKAAS